MQDHSVSEWTFFENAAEEETAKEWLRLWMQCFIRKTPEGWQYVDKEWIHKDPTADTKAVIGLKIYFKAPLAPMAQEPTLDSKVQECPSSP